MPTIDQHLAECAALQSIFKTESLKAACIAIAHAALLPVGINQVQSSSSHKDVRMAVPQQARNPAGTGVNILTLRGLDSLGVLQRQLVPHFVRNLLLDVRRQLGRAARTGGSAVHFASLLMRSIGRLQVLADHVVRQPVCS